MTPVELLLQVAMAAVPAEAKTAAIGKLTALLPELLQLYASQQGLQLVAAEVEIVDERKKS